MGCCCSRDASAAKKNKKKGPRIWYMPWKRRKSAGKTPPRATGADAPYTIRYSYEKTAGRSTRSSVSVESGMVDAPKYVALWKFRAANKAELDLDVGDKLRLMGDPSVDEVDPAWIFVIREEQSDRRLTGYVPRAYVALEGSLEAEPYYFGACSAEKAELYLKGASDGTFLVRARPEFSSCPIVPKKEQAVDAGISARQVGKGKSAVGGSTSPSGSVKSVITPRKGSGSGGGKQASFVTAKSISKKQGGGALKGKQIVPKDQWSMLKGEIIVHGKKACAEYAISVKADGKVVHIPIYHEMVAFRGGYFVIQVRKFGCVQDVITYYTSNRENEIPCELKGSPKKTPPVRVALSPEAQKTWREIPRAQITLGDQIGKGHFGVVYKGTWKSSDAAPEIPVAVKALKKDTEKARRKFLQEAVTMRNLTHQHLVKLHGIVSADEPCWIITEYVKDGSLREYLIKKRTVDNRLTEKTLFQVCAQIADAMQYLESKSVVHRDLAARNVLVIEKDAGEPWAGKDPVLSVKVADFGLAHVLTAEKKAKGGSAADEMTTKKSAATVPTKWTAPEALLHNNYSSASDVWSFGIVIHEVFTHGQEPYGILQHQAVRDYVCKRKQILVRHKDVPEPVYALMEKCFKFDPAQRPHFAELFTFFDSYFNKDKNKNMKKSAKNGPR